MIISLNGPVSLTGAPHDLIKQIKINKKSFIKYLTNKWDPTYYWNKYNDFINASGWNVGPTSQFDQSKAPAYDKVAPHVRLTKSTTLFWIMLILND